MRGPSTQSSSHNGLGRLPPVGHGYSSRIGGGDRDSNEKSSLLNFGRKRSAGSGGESSKKNKRMLTLWNHDYVCLSETYQDKTPTAYERALLVAAGSYMYKLICLLHLPMNIRSTGPVLPVNM